MAVFKFTLKEMRKHKTRTLIITLIVALMISVPTVYYNVVATIGNTETKSFNTQNVAEITVYTSDKEFNSTTEELLLDQISNIEVLERRIFLEGIALNAEKNAVITLEGIPYSFSLNMFTLPEANLTLNKGQCFVEETGARYLSWLKDENITIISENGTFDLEIVSLVSAPWAVSHSVPRNVYVFVPMSYLETSLNITGLYNGMRIKVKDITQVYDTLNQITDLLENYGWKVFAYVSTSGGLRAQMNIIKGIFLIIGYPILLIGAAIIITILIQQSEQKYRETAVMKAIGFSKQQVIRYYFYKIAIWSILGGILGFTVGLIVHFMIIKFLIYPILGNVIFTLDVKSMAMNFIFTVGLLSLFSIFPALKAYKLAAMEALQHEFGCKKTKKIKESKKSLPFSNLFLNSIRYLIRKKKQGIALVFGIAIATSMTATVIFVSNDLSGTIKDSFLEANRYDSLIFTGVNLNEGNISVLETSSYIENLEGYLWVYAIRGETTIDFNNKTLEPDDSILLVGTTENRELYVPTIIKGRLPKNNASEIVISQKFAKYTGLKVNDTLTLSSKLNLKWSFKQTLLICGIATTVMQNSMTFLLDIEYLAYKINATQEPYNTLAVTFSSESSQSTSLENFLLQLEDAGITVKQAFLKQVLFTGLSQIMNTFSLMLNVFSIMILIALSIGIFSFVFHNINERKREFALLNAIGGTKADILKILLYELMIILLCIFSFSIPFTFLGEKLLQTVVNNSTIPFWLDVHFGIFEIGFVILLPLIVYLLSIISAMRHITNNKTVEILRETFIS